VKTRYNVVFLLTRADYFCFKRFRSHLKKWLFTRRW